MRENREEKMLPLKHPRTSLTPKRFVGAFPPFPRSTWIHPHEPSDDFDRVCETIWRRAKEAEEELGTGRRSVQRQQKKECTAPDCKPSRRAEKPKKQTDDLGLSTVYKEDKHQYHTDFILPCPYLSGRRHPHVAKPARVLSPVMEVEMKRNEVEEKRERNLRDLEDKRRSVENSLNKIWVTQSSSRRDTQSFAPEPQSLAPNPICSVIGDTSYLQEKEDPPLPSKLPWDTCESEDEQNVRNNSDSNSSSDGELVTLPVVRNCATDDDSASVNNDSDEEKNEIPHTDVLRTDNKQDFPSSSIEKDFLPLSTIKAGILPCPKEPPALGKILGQCEIPLSFHPHDIPTTTLASSVTTHSQAPVHGKAEVPQANSKTNAPPAASMQQEAYDLLDDFPALQPPKKPLALDVLRDADSKTKTAKGKIGPAHSTNHCQESGASHQRRMENVLHEVSSIRAGDQKSVLDLQTLGLTSQPNSPTISCEELKANTQPPPKGTDGVGVNARSWASVAKVGMKQAAAPQEKARPRTFQQIVTINGAKAAQNFANKVTPLHQASSPWVTAMHRGPRPRCPNWFVRPHKPQFGARTHHANCPPAFRCPRFPFQQARGHPSKHNHV